MATARRIVGQRREPAAAGDDRQRQPVEGGGRDELSHAPAPLRIDEDRRHHLDRRVDAAQRADRPQPRAAPRPAIQQEAERDVVPERRREAADVR